MDHGVADGRPALLARRGWDFLTAGIRERHRALSTYRCLRAQRRAMRLSPNGPAAILAPPSERKLGGAPGGGEDQAGGPGPARLQLLAAEPIDPRAWDKCTLEHCFRSWALAATIKWSLLVAGTVGAFAGRMEVAVAGWLFAGLFQALQMSSSADLARGLKRVQRESRQLYMLAELRCAEPVRSGAFASDASPESRLRRWAGEIGKRVHHFGEGHS
jgi:hypothetical protein